VAESVPLDKQVACAKRELALRKRVYPTWVTAKRMNQFKAEEEIAAMAAIVATLEGLARKSPA
jgi:hypothetical protein